MTTDQLTVGPWRASRMSGRLERPGEARDLEPKVMDLLFLLADQRGEVVGRDAILAALWPGVTVGEDALSRCVFKLRRALDDDPKAPRFVETVPKRGYRLIAEGPAQPQSRRPLLYAGLAILLVALAIAVALMTARAPSDSDADRLVRRADDLYFQFDRRNNEAAVTLYERAIEAEPTSVAARAGLANALVQQVIRYIGPPPPRTRLSEALARGVGKTPEGASRLTRARAVAESAVHDAPRDPVALKALGFVLAAQGDLAGAETVYRRALASDPDAWGVMINLGETADLRGDPAAALPLFERAYGAMSRLYGQEAVRISPWQSELGVEIARRHAAAGRPAQAHAWYRRVLANTPLHPAATAGLAALLTRQGDRPAAVRLCRELVERAGPAPECAAFL